MTLINPAAQCLAALGHDARLAIFRLLVRAGEEGLTVGEIGRHMSMPASTLAHHLRSLVEASLVIQERQGREVVNRANFVVMRRTVDFLTSECCAGVDDVARPTAA